MRVGRSECVNLKKGWFLHDVIKKFKLKNFQPPCVFISIIFLSISKTFLLNSISELLLLAFCLLSRRKCSRSLRSSGQELLTVPLAKLKTYGDRAFSIAAPRQWNNLPLSIRKSPSIAILEDI